MAGEVTVAVVASFATFALNVVYTNIRVSKERRLQALGTLVEKIEEVDELARLYFVSDPSSDECKFLGQRVKGRIRSLARSIKKLAAKHHKLDKSEVNQKLINFRQAITGGDFEEASRAKSTREDRRMTSIAFATSELVEAIEKGI